MNRRERRRLRLGHGPLTLDAVRCPDCDSVVDLAEKSPGHYVGVIAHDPTCPWLARLARVIR